jgi:molybdate transport system substrate-binding protein
LKLIIVLTLIFAVVIGGALYSMYYRTPSSTSGEIIVDAAPIAKPILDKVVGVFENKTGVKVDVSYDATGVIYTKIKEGAPIDVVVFASSDWGLKALNEGLVYPTPSTGLGYQLVVVYVRASTPYNITCLDDLARYNVKIGVANPDVAPAGYEALRIINQSPNAGLLKSKIVVAKDIAELATWFKIGVVDVAFIWNTFNSTLANLTKAVIYPWRCGYNTTVYYSPVYISKTSRNVQEARELVEFLSSDYVKNVERSLGFFATEEEARVFMRSTST